MPCLVSASHRLLWDVYQVPKVNVARCLFEHPYVEVDAVEVVVHIKVRVVVGAHKGEHGARFLARCDLLAHVHIADHAVDVGIGVHIAKHHVDTGVVGHRKDERSVPVAVGVLARAGNMDVLVRLQVDGELFLGVGAQALGIDDVFVYFVEALRWRRFLDGFGAARVRFSCSGFAIRVAAAQEGQRARCNGECSYAGGA